MAYIECDISSISSSYHNMAAALLLPGAVINETTLFGTKSMWIRLPAYAPPIGEMPIGASTAGWGAQAEVAFSTTVFGTNARRITELTIGAYQRGTLWFRITKPTLTKLIAGSYQKKLKVWYRSTNELVPPSL